MAHLAFGDLFVLTFLLHARVVLGKKKEKTKQKRGLVRG